MEAYISGTLTPCEEVTVQSWRLDCSVTYTGYCTWTHPVSTQMEGHTCRAANVLHVELIQRVCYVFSGWRRAETFCCCSGLSGPSPTDVTTAAEPSSTSRLVKLHTCTQKDLKVANTSSHTRLLSSRCVCVLFLDLLRSMSVEDFECLPSLITSLVCEIAAVFLSFLFAIRVILDFPVSSEGEKISRSIRGTVEARWSINQSRLTQNGNF